MATVGPIYLVNLTRRPDKRARVGARLDALGLPWTWISAIDGRDHPNGPPDPQIQPGRIIPMTLGSQCYAATFLKTLRRFVESNAPIALFLQDDVTVSADLPQLLASIDWLPKEIGLVQLEKWQERRGAKLLGPSIVDLPPKRQLHRLYSRTGGAAGFLIRRRAAKTILALPAITTPIDHLLFSPNLSPIFDRVGVGLIRPSFVIQDAGSATSDIAEWRRATPPRAHLRRALTEINRAPQQVSAMVWQGARWRETWFA